MTRLERHAGAYLVAFGVLAAAVGAQTPQGGLTLLDTVRTTLDRQPTIRLAEERLLASRGDLQAANGQFDATVNSGFNDVGSKTPNTAFEQEFQRLPSSSTANIATLNAGFTKLLRSGQVLNPSMSLERTDVTGVTTPANRASVSVFMVQPLLRGRDAQAVTANVRAGSPH